MSTNTVANVMPKHLDVRLLASDLGVQPIELVRELQADGVPLLPVSKKRWRVTEGDYAAWIQARRAKADEEGRQWRMRMQHVEGKKTMPNTPTTKVRFRR
ncbi:MAG: hypothetical protein IPK26_00900 [Planctomycetes bacterium]|nr:hypothetical protein [Planctomycetota bacterium]